MNSERTQAYGRVIKTLDEIGPAKLLPTEQERIRDAADTLIFAAEPEDARAAITDIRELCEHLVGVDRWTRERADELLANLESTGPVSPVF